MGVGGYVSGRGVDCEIDIHIQGAKVGVGLNHAGETRLSQAVGYINTGFVRAELAVGTAGGKGD